MNTNDTLVLRAACESFVGEYVAYSLAMQCRLETVEKNLLAQKILLLPEVDRSLIFLKFYFGFTPSAIGEILGIPNAKERLNCCAELLAVALERNDAIIDDESMKAAAYRSMNSMFSNDQTNTALPHLYSAAFRRQLDGITTIPHRGRKVLLFVKRIAIAALIAVMMFTTALAASPVLRNLVFEWVVNTFPPYSQIGAVDVIREPTVEDFEILKQYYPTYVPEGYELFQVMDEFSPIIYDYRNSVGAALSFVGDIPSGSLTSYNTEGSSIQELTYLRQPAFYWVQDGFTYFIWQQDGFQFNVIGKISKEEAFKMAKGTKFHK